MEAVGRWADRYCFHLLYGLSCPVSSGMMLRHGPPLSVRTVCDCDHSPAAVKIIAACSLSSHRICFSPHLFLLRLNRSTRCLRHSRKSNPFSCKSVHGSSHAPDEGRDYLQASVLDSETMKHYQMRRQGLGFAEDFREDADSIGLEFLRHFRTPTIFLKISCDGDFLLPISVGEFAVESLIGTLNDGFNEDCPNQFQFARQLLGELGYQAEMVKITERVVNTYVARIYFSKPGVKDILVVDARPSDAIILAKICTAPIYVNKQIVLTDAIGIVYRLGRVNVRKAVYDVTLDSAADGPDILAEELDLVRNIMFAVEEERYKDAAIWRDRLRKLRMSADGQ